MKQTLKFCAWSMSWLLLGSVLWAAPTIAHSPNVPSSPWHSSQGDRLSPDQVLHDLAQSTVIYLGETHDNPADHQAQLQIIQALQQRHSQLAIAMEMFQRPYQESLTQYLAGHISETELLQQTQYEQRWGFPWQYYAPIVQFAKAQQLPIIALNTPSEVTRQVAQTGLDSLSPEALQWIPPLSEIDLNHAAYRQRIQEVFNSIHQGHSFSGNFDYFFQAQVLWDETMADSIASFLNTHPGYHVVVLAGQGHIIYGDGIPSRVARRLQNRRGFQQRSLLLNPDELTLNELSPDALSPDKAIPRREPVADYFWLSSTAKEGITDSSTGDR
ncbi:MAG: ChaN family lipoprotein [Leptolyngbyaceae cyanobacterium CRU_2_3]|nr:ChaN family lipoprotein [Leptolyngbyaceae cyanobacterium CRU_2_3]